MNSLVDGKLTSDFKFPDPIRDRETPFCPIDPLLTTNAEVRCTNSAFRTEFNEMLNAIQSLFRYGNSRIFEKFLGNHDSYQK